MFTDIAGSTSFFEQQGDIKGRSMLQEYNDILFPLIQNHNGAIIKTMGDGIMASFLSPQDGVRSAIEIQFALSERNKTKKRDDYIIVRIGLNYGKGIVQDDDVFGDVVNVAAKVESIAKEGQILVSKTIYDQVQQTEDIIFQSFDTIPLKGKAEPLEIYRVVWDTEEMIGNKTVFPQEIFLKYDKTRKISNGALLATLIGSLLIMVAVIFFRILPNELLLTAGPIENAYLKLKSGNIEEAEKQFRILLESLGAESLSGYEGLAATFFQRGDYQKAQKLCERVINSDSKNIYAHVIIGNISFNQGDLHAAIQAYTTASQGKNGFVWQKAEAYNRLGRIYSEQNQTETALSFYDKAIELDPENSEAMSNKGFLLVGLGKNEEAIASYRKSLKRNPDDEFSAFLLNQSLIKEKGAADRARQDRIDKIVDELTERFKKQKPETKPAYPADTWTSRPITITLLDFQNRVSISVRAGENEYLAAILTQLFQETERISVVERELIDKLMQELNLSSSGLADFTTALKLGKIIGARFIATGNVMRLGGEMQVTLRLIETETSTITGAFTKIDDRSADLNAIAKSFVKKINQTLIEKFPLQGKLASVDGEEVILNIGAKAGVRAGLKMDVFQEAEPIIMDGREIGKRKVQVGKIEIMTVEEDMSTGKIINKISEFMKGQKTLELQQTSNENSKTEI